MNDFTTKDSGERLSFASGMVRDVTKGKILWHLISSGPMLKRWAQLLTRGAEKYSADNWMKANGKEEYDRFRESAYRHFMQWYYGEIDEDHGAAVIFNINGAEYVKLKIDLDDQISKRDKIIGEYEEMLKTHVDFISSQKYCDTETEDENLSRDTKLE